MSESTGGVAVRNDQSDRIAGGRSSRACHRHALPLQALIVLALAALNAVVFWPALGNDFVYDDRHIFEEPRALGGLNREGVTWALTSTDWALYAPLARLSAVMDFQFYGRSPRGHHLTSLLVHTANSALLFWALAALTGATRRSAAAAILFAVHPLNVEPAAWISGRSDLLAALFFMSTLLAWRGYLRRPGWLRWLLSSCLFFLGMMSKIIIMTLPFVLLLLDYWPFGRLARPGADPPTGGGPTRRPHRGSGAVIPLLVEKSGLLLVTVTMVVVTLLLLREAFSASSEQYPLPARVATIFVSYATYIGRMLWPAGLTVEYPHTWGSYPWWKPAGSAVLILGVTAWALLLARRLPYLVVGWFWFLGTLFPVIGVYQAREYLMADRYAYLPLIGLFVMAAWGFADLMRGRRWGNAACTAALGAVVAASLPASRAQTAYWHDDITLFERAAQVTRGNARALFSLGSECLARGDLRRAREHLAEAVRIRPQDAKMRSNLGNALVQGGDLAAGIAEYRAALRINPGLAEVRVNLGAALHRLQRFSEAETEYREALRLQPGQEIAHMNLANLLSEHGRVEEALAHYAEALRLKPNHADAYANRGVMLARIGRGAQAVSDYREALRLDPGNAIARRGLGLK